jgi:hypothetical protein
MSRIIRAATAILLASSLGACAVVPMRETVVVHPGLVRPGPVVLPGPVFVPGHVNAWGRWVPGHDA